MRPGILFSILFFSMGTLFQNDVSAQIMKTKLLPGDGGEYDIFGASVSLSGDYALVGASGAAAAYVFRFDGFDWVEEAKLLPDDGDAGLFGNSVSISGDRAIVGAWNDYNNAEDDGSAFVFHREGISWVEEAKLLPGDGARHDYFGRSVSISGDVALAGAFGDDDNGLTSGSAYVFRREGTSWVEEAKIVPSDGDEHDLFGFSASIEGDYALVGAMQDGDNGSWSGSAYIFHREGTDWVEAAKLLPGDGHGGDYFGYSVSIEGDYILVGAPQDGDNGFWSGSAYIFRREGTGWVEEAKLTAGDGGEQDLFGHSVSLSGDYALVGAKGDDDLSGAAYFFVREGEGWVEKGKLSPSDGEGGDGFGEAASLSGENALVGAFLDDDNGFNSGSAYLYSELATGCSFSISLKRGEHYPGETVPFEVSIHHKRAATVTVPINAWIEDSEGSIIATTLSDPLTIHQGDFINQEMGLSLPEDLLPGTYRVHASIGEMQQGVAKAGERFQVVSGYTDKPSAKSDAVPENVRLGENYPNPFNPTTTIRYELNEAAHVSLKIYDMLGQRVALLVNGEQEVGYHRVVFDAEDLPSGIYFYRLQAADFVATKKLLLLK